MKTISSVLHDGLVIGPTETKHGELIYAEITPATPLLVWDKDRPGWRRFVPVGGRVWREAHIRWWIEIHSTNVTSTEDNPLGVGRHYYEHDDGAITLRQAILKASIAVEAAVEQSEEEVKDVSTVVFD